MTEEILFKIQSNPLIESYLKENSYQYKYLYRDSRYLKKVEELAKEYYHERMIDKIERLKGALK